MENQNEFTNSKGAMQILLIKSKTTLAKYEREMMFKVYRIGNRKRYKISELLKFITKGCNRSLFFLMICTVKFHRKFHRTNKKPLLML